MDNEKGRQATTKVARRSGAKSFALSSSGGGFEILVMQDEGNSSVRVLGFDYNIIK